MLQFAGLRGPQPPDSGGPLFASAHSRGLRRLPPECNPQPAKKHPPPCEKNVLQKTPAIPQREFPAFREATPPPARKHPPPAKSALPSARKTPSLPRIRRPPFRRRCTPLSEAIFSPLFGAPNGRKYRFRHKRNTIRSLFILTDYLHYMQQKLHFIRGGAF